jgi:hypothetical protein
MKAILIFTFVGSVLFIAAYYVFVRQYYWGPKVKKDDEKRDN